MEKLPTLDDFELEGRTVLVRIDVNSPIDPKSKKILDDSRIRAHIPTINEISEKGGKVVILAHQGRPGSEDFLSLREHAIKLEQALGKKVIFLEDTFGPLARKSIKSLKNGEILMLENIRYYSEESLEKSPEFHAKSVLVHKISPLINLFVNDAFSAAHRSQCSLVGFTKVVPSACGRLLEKEVNALNRITSNPKRPCIYIFGGAKLEDSLEVMDHVLTTKSADTVLLGGLVGNTFLLGKGFPLGKSTESFLEKKGCLKYLEKVKTLLNKFSDRIILPVDVAADIMGSRKEYSLQDLPIDGPIYDIGNNSVIKFSEIIKTANNIFLNGPLGYYENESFAMGTEAIFKAVANSKAFSVVGGGHTIAALDKLGLKSQISYISSGGGALIRYLMGKKMPVIEALEQAWKE